MSITYFFIFFFFNDTATTEIYTLSLHDALPITARLWDPQTGKELRRYVGHALAVTSVAFSPDGQSVLTGSYDNTARLWDPQTGKELRRLYSHVTGGIRGVAFSPDGRYVLTGGDDQT